MQLHRLRLTAIGPFVEPVEIDLDRLSASGIFLLEGPTGAGKSTLIDAIVFALYGEVAARSSSADRMASAVAADGVRPRVELDFSTGRGVYRIARTPKHERRKRRGSGTTTEPASATLWRLLSPDAGALVEPVSTRIDEIAAEVLDIVGLSREQFVQTVVLPQGEFATFLRADAEHRRVLLQRLFGTEVYDRTVDRLVELRRQARQRASDAALVTVGAVRSYCGASGRTGEEEDALVGLLDRDPDQLIAVLQQQVDVAISGAKAAEAKLASTSAAAKAARAELDTLQRREHARLRVVELQAELAELDRGAEQLAADRHRLDAADHAARLLPAIEGLAEAERRDAGLQSALDAARAALPAPEAPHETWADQARALAARTGELELMQQVETEVADAQATLDEHRARCGELSARSDELRSTLAEAPAALDRLRAQLTAAAATQANLQVATGQLEAARSTVEAGRALDDTVQAIAAAALELDKARAAAQQAVTRAAALRSRFIDGIAGHLATELHPGDPCPVCGSCDHPRPAARSTDDVDRAAVDSADGTASEATERVEQAVAEVARLQTRAAELRGVTAGVATDELIARSVTAEAGVAAAQSAERIAAQLRGELDEREAAVTEQRAELEQLDAESHRLGAAMTAMREGLAVKQAQLTEAAAGHESIAARVAALRAEESLWREALGAHDRATAAASDARTRQREVEQALASSPFTDRTQVLAAYLEQSDRDDLRGDIDRRRAQRAHCESQLASDELLGVDASKVVDVTAATERVASVERELRQAHEVAARSSQRLTDSSERADEVQTAIAAARAVAVETAPIIRIADLASASSPDNAKAMSLPTFVVRERFVEVVASANRRLATMSDGRYLLEHVESRRGNRKSGLELQVRDAHVEQPRHPATLSGGETFYCSLALALGLADVVTAEAGGLDLGTLFVDEGFGSLDPDTLDQVLEVLQGLADSGRTVGVVSHVPELKEQIAERISVIPNRDGSSRLVVAA